MGRKAVDRESQHYRIDGAAKTAWDTAQQAQKHAVRQSKQYRTGAPLSVYQCSVCQRFHIGRKRGRRQSGGWK